MWVRRNRGWLSAHEQNEQQNMVILVCYFSHK